MVRVPVMVLVCALGAVSAIAEELGPEQAKAFVAGKLFAYTCFDGTVGKARIFSDGSVIGTIRPEARGDARFITLPPGTIRVNSKAVCAHFKGSLIEPCFTVQKTDHRSFRGSIAGLSFAYCDFSQLNPRAGIIGRTRVRN
jgi:hypothetical protein